MGNTPVCSLTEGMEKTERHCAQQQGCITGTQEQAAAQSREGDTQEQKHGIQQTAYMHGLCIRQGRDVPVYDLDFLSEV